MNQVHALKLFPDPTSSAPAVGMDLGQGIRRIHTPLVKPPPALGPRGPLGERGLTSASIADFGLPWRVPPRTAPRSGCCVSGDTKQTLRPLVSFDVRPYVSYLSAPYTLSIRDRDYCDADEALRPSGDELAATVPQDG